MNNNIFINKTIKIFNESKYNNLIEFIYKNINFIINNFNEFLLHYEKYELDLLLNSSVDIKKINISDKNSDSPFIICSLFQIVVLKLVTIFSHYNLESINEINNNKNIVTYELIICDNDIKIKLFSIYLILFYIESNIRKKIFDYKLNSNKTFVGIDYEFNNRIIALMQINFERLYSDKKNTTSHIFIINPGEFNDNDKNILLKYLMTNKSCYKILHGCDSLDLPYMYEVLFNNDTKIIKDFTTTVFDTRFFCEYYKLTLDLEKKCTIYDALLFFKVINTEKFNDLNTIHDYMGPVQDISWNIKKMSSYHIKYALYDVLFLRYFLLNIYKLSYENTNKYYKSYLLIAPITRFIFIDKKEITKIILNSKKNIDPINNFHIKVNNKNITLISIYNEVINDLKIKNWQLDIHNILMINYFRTGLVTIFKNIIYFLIIKNFKVYEKKNIIFNQKFELDHIFDTFNENKYLNLLLLFINEFKFVCEQKILNIYK